MRNFRPKIFAIFAFFNNSHSKMINFEFSFFRIFSHFYPVQTSKTSPAHAQSHLQWQFACKLLKCRKLEPFFCLHFFFHIS